MFNRTQRNVLNQLSEELFGSSSKWQKLLDKGAFRVNKREVKVDATKYVKASNGVIMNADKAYLKDLITKEYYDGLETVQQVGDRPTYDELVKSMEYLLDLRTRQIAENTETTNNDHVLEEKSV